MIRSQPTRLFLLASLLVCLPLAGWAEETKSSKKEQAESQEPSLWTQHVRVLSYNWATRFRYIDNGPGAVTSRDLQYHNSLRLRINDDAGAQVLWNGDGITIGKRAVDAALPARWTVQRTHGKPKKMRFLLEKNS